MYSATWRNFGGPKMMGSWFYFGSANTYATRIARPTCTPLNFEKVVKCISATMHVHPVITMSKMWPKLKRRG